MAKDNLITVLGWIKNDSIPLIKIQKKIGLNLRRTIRTFQKFSDAAIDKDSDIIIGELKIGIPQLANIIKKEQQEYLKHKTLAIARFKEKAEQKEKRKKKEAKSSIPKKRKKSNRSSSILSDKTKNPKLKKATPKKEQHLKLDEFPMLEEPDEYRRSKKIKLIGKYKQ